MFQLDETTTNAIPKNQPDEEIDGKVSSVNQIKEDEIKRVCISRKSIENIKRKFSIIKKRLRDISVKKR